ncbi:MAG: hybrid sensor histidine kinase/response regulator [Myxococcales bacterium]|nr:hybrid sensor histidine kinase/response regulator [Myxococcales bacterium]MCB9718315.1 hybrid sensor histidine kinase/response regulator [Myxococcales bacterium]
MAEESSAEAPAAPGQRASSDPRRKLFLAGGALALLQHFIRPAGHPIMDLGLSLVLAAAMVVTGLVPGPGGRLNRWLAAITGLVMVTVLAIQAGSGGGMDPAGTVWVMTLPLLYLVVVPNDPMVSGVCLTASTIATAMLVQRTSAEPMEMLLWVTQALIVGVIAVIGSVLFRRERERDLARERERAHVAKELAVSERMRTRAEELATMGRMAAEVSHEINNPLTYVSSNLEYLRDTLPEAGRWRPVDEALEQALAGTERIQQIVADLLAIARPSDEVIDAPVDEAVREALRMAHNEIRHHARLVTRIESRATVCTNPRRLTQLFLNLLTNAAQAIEAGQAAANQIHVSTTVEGDRVVVRVKDTGRGIPAGLHPQVFEAFFTTKRAGGGTGLGLPVCKRIVDELGGEITFSSTVGMGTEFVVRLPASTARPRPEPKAVTTTAEGRASILIVDDDPLVGSSIGRLLRRSHEVIIANSGLAALERLDSGVEFDLVLCDLMMPDMTGMDFYGRVHELFPEVTERFVFMTGGAFTEAAARFIERTEHPVLTKPIRTATLREVVASALARRATSDEEGPSSPAA